MKHKKEYIKVSQKITCPFLIIICIVIIVAFTWYEIIETDKDMREVLLLQTYIGERSLNVKNITSLTGTSDDLSNPGYLQLKQQFASMLTSNKKLRFVYLMGCNKTGSIVFYADDSPAGHPEEAPAGTIYSDAPQGFYDVLKTGVARVESPFTDRWGTFVSGCVPVTDPETQKTIAIFAIDFDANQWYADIAKRAALPVSLLLVIFLSVISGFFQYIERGNYG